MTSKHHARNEVDSARLFGPSTHLTHFDIRNWHVFLAEECEKVGFAWWDTAVQYASWLLGVPVVNPYPQHIKVKTTKYWLDLWSPHHNLLLSNHMYIYMQPSPIWLSYTSLKDVASLHWTTALGSALRNMYFFCPEESRMGEQHLGRSRESHRARSTAGTHLKGWIVMASGWVIFWRERWSSSFRVHRVSNKVQRTTY